MEDKESLLKSETVPHRSSRIAALAMLLIAGSLLAWFSQNSSGGLPGAPQIWKGDLVLLLSGFLGCYGALMLFLRRFSLSASLVSIFLSGLLTAGAHAYVFSFEATDIRTISPSGHASWDTEHRNQVINEDRLLAFGRDSNNSDRVQGGFDFHSFQISRVGTGRALSLEFEYNPVVFKRRSQMRPLLAAYGELLVSTQQKGVQEMAFPLRFKELPTKYVFGNSKLETAIRHLLRLQENLRGLERWEESLKKNKWKTAMEMAQLARYKRRLREFPRSLRSDLEFMAKRETDPELKRYLETILDANGPGPSKKSRGGQP